jgi:hypothetical protein
VVFVQITGGGIETKDRQKHKPGVAASDIWRIQGLLPATKTWKESNDPKLESKKNESRSSIARPKKGGK